MERNIAMDKTKATAFIGKLVAKNTNVGYMVMRDGRLELRGFRGLMNHKVKIETQNGVLLLAPDNSLTGTECVKFTEEALSSAIMTDYFRQNDAIGCLFVCVWGVWTQCKGVHIEEAAE